MATPTTSPLIEGIIEEFLENFPTKDLVIIDKYIDNMSTWNFTDRFMNELLSSLQKVESETVERCLKALPLKRDFNGSDWGISEDCDYTLANVKESFNSAIDQSLSAIKKEFNKE